MGLADSTLSAEQYASLGIESYALLPVDPTGSGMQLAAQQAHCPGAVASDINNHSLASVHCPGAAASEVN